MKEDYQELDELKSALKRKQQHPEEGDVDVKISREDLFKAVVDLSSQIKELVEIFKLAAEGMKTEDKAYEDVKSKLDAVLKNDQDLAKGILMIIDSQKERDEQLSQIKSLQMRVQQMEPQSIQSQPMSPKDETEEIEPLAPTLPPRTQQARNFNLFNTVYPNMPASPQPVRVTQEKEPARPTSGEGPEVTKENVDLVGNKYSKRVR